MKELIKKLTLPQGLTWGGWHQDYREILHDGQMIGVFGGLKVAQDTAAAQRELNRTVAKCLREQDILKRWEVAASEGKPYLLNPFRVRYDKEHKCQVVVQTNDIAAYEPGKEQDVFLTPTSKTSMAVTEEIANLIVGGHNVSRLVRTQDLSPLGYMVRFPDLSSRIEFVLRFEWHDRYEIQGAK